MTKKVTKKELDTARAFGRQFEYKYDPQYGNGIGGKILGGLLDKWIILKQQNDGRYYGDCEDFSLTVLYLIKGKSLRKFLWSFITGEAKMYYIKVRGGGGHAVMGYKDKYIDNWSREFTSKKHMTDGFGHKFIYRLWFPEVFIRMIIGTTVHTFLKLIGRAK